MTRLIAIALLLAGCAGPAPSADQVSCERQANDDPLVREMLLKAAGNPHYLLDEQDAMRAAKQDAALRCLRGRGVIRPGGVERQKPL